MPFGSPKDCIWMETGKPILAQATQFSQVQSLSINNVGLGRFWMAGFEGFLGRVTKTKNSQIQKFPRTIYIYIHTGIRCI